MHNSYNNVIEIFSQNDFYPQIILILFPIRLLSLVFLAQIRVHDIDI
uniref:Uncharacterized protein n=1 Tax=Rhizophora mucronata TaxID=61149 RepID=A0A2P2PVD6_RHIMU